MNIEIRYYFVYNMQLLGCGIGFHVKHCFKIDMSDQTFKETETLRETSGLHVQLRVDFI